MQHIWTLHRRQPVLDVLAPKKLSPKIWVVINGLPPSTEAVDDDYAGLWLEHCRSDPNFARVKVAERHRCIVQTQDDGPNTVHVGL